MKKTILILVILTFLKGFLTYGQEIVNHTNSKGYSEIPQEKLFVHFNTSFLLSGEYFYYKVYCINNKTNKLSNISKIAYVELVGNNKAPVFKHKIKLDSGIGQGDYFVPTSIASGNYKLIAYTQWMRNGEKIRIFQSDISIINPFQANQPALIKEEVSDEIQKYGLDTKSVEEIINRDRINDEQNIELDLNSNFYSSREKVSLKINSLQGEKAFGTYSISIRKIEPVSIPERLSSSEYMSLSLQNKSSKSAVADQPVFLPELRGELISGKVFNNDSDSPVSNIKVGISFPGKNYIFKIANTNELGIFYFNIDRENKSEYAIIQVIDKEKEKFRISVDPQEALLYNNLKFSEFSISPELKDLILEHSIYNQVENSFNIVKPDSTYEFQSISPFFHSNAQTFLLDDYTRFPSIKETTVEIIEPVFLRQKNGEYTFHVKIYEEDIESGLLPLVLVDGILIQNHTELVDFNARKVKSISVVSEQYVYGSQLFEGIISFETFDGDFKNNAYGNYIKEIDLFKPLANKKYFNQIYRGSSKLDRIPDFRTQLLWEPDLILNNNEVTISFYTSDVNGDYEICLEGFTREGKAISLKEMITVK